MPPHQTYQNHVCIYTLPLPNEAKVAQKKLFPKEVSVIFFWIIYPQISNLSCYVSPSICSFGVWWFFRTHLCRGRTYLHCAEPTQVCSVWASKGVAQTPYYCKLFHIHTLVGTLVVQASVEIFLPISDSYLVHFHLVWHRRYQCQVKSKVKCEQSAPQAKVNVSHHLICIASDGALGADVGWWCFVYMLMLCVDVGAFGALPALCCSVVGCSAVVSLTWLTWACLRGRHHDTDSSIVYRTLSEEQCRLQSVDWSRVQGQWR